MQKAMMLFAGVLIACAAHGAATTHLSLDCREVIQVDAGGADLVYDASWWPGGYCCARLLADGKEIASGERGVVHWQPSGFGNYLLELVLDNWRGDKYSSTISHGQGLCDVKVHSGWPWKEVLIEYTIVGAIPLDRELKIMAADNENGKIYECKTLEGVGHAPGTYVVKWNASVDGAKFCSSNVTFTLSTVKVGGVQLWDGGPYWAECNVGATKPEEYGYYFWWGDTVGYKRNAADDGWVSVIDGSSFWFTESLTYGKDDLQSAGSTDAASNLVAAHDAATVHLGAPWRMPTDAEMNALVNNCTTTWTSRNGVTGVLVTGKGAYASRSIFLPAAGYGNYSDLCNSGSSGYYWSSAPYSHCSGYAWNLYFGSGDFYYRDYNHDRYGLSVRPVRVRAK